MKIKYLLMLLGCLLFFVGVGPLVLEPVIYDIVHDDDAEFVTVKDELTRKEVRELLYFRDQYFFLLEKVNSEILVNYDNVLIELAYLKVKYSLLEDRYENLKTYSTITTVVGVVELGILIFQK